MADNVTANAGSGGAVFASDDIGGVQYPRTKMVWGADGSVNDTSAAAPLPVDASGVAVPVTDNGGALTVDGAVTVSATNLDIRDLAFASDTVDVTGSAVTVSGTVAVTQSGTWDEVGINDSGNSITVDGSVFATPAIASTATLSNVNASTSSVTLLSANSARLGAIIANDSNKSLYVKLGTTASTTSYTALMSSGSYYEVPFGYTGRIDGIWAGANGAARVTELTA